MGKGRKRSRSSRGGGGLQVVRMDQPALQEEEDDALPTPKRQAVGAGTGEGEGWRCAVCEVRFNSAAQWEGHLKGKKHRHRLQSTTPTPTAPADPSSDTEDYDVFRQRAPRIKKKKKRDRDRERDRQPDPDDPEQGEASSHAQGQDKKPQSAQGPSPRAGSHKARLEGCAWLSAFCRVRHACERPPAAGKGQEGWRESCAGCGKDRRDDKLLVSLTHCPIRQVAFLPKAKFHAHATKGIAFLQWFVLCLDLRVTACVLRSVRWSQALYKEMEQVGEQLEQCRADAPFHSVESACVSKVRTLLKEDLHAILFPPAPTRAARRAPKGPTGPGSAGAAGAAGGGGGLWEGEALVRLACVVDQIYFELYYAWMAVLQAYQQHALSPHHAHAPRPHDQPFTHVWTPVEYLQWVQRVREALGAPSAAETRRVYLQEVVGLSAEERAGVEGQVWAGANALLQCYLLRYTETIHLFPVRPVPATDLTQQPRTRPTQSREPPCLPLEQQWRDSCRDWICHLYAYAVPHEPSLAALARMPGQLVEVGAGTGYWGDLLLKRAHAASAIHLYDSHPLSTTPQPEESKSARKKEANVAHNEYHGRALAFTAVRRGGCTDLKILTQAQGGGPSDSTLLLCYPPPACRMALDCLESFGGQRVALIGEWRGDTATPDFEKALVRGFSLERAIGLPNWSNTSYCLSLWVRRTSPLPKGETTPFSDGEASHPRSPRPASVMDILQGGALPFECSGCGLRKKNLRRCICCAQVSYCSAACCSSHAPVHQQLHRFYFIHTLDPLPYSPSFYHKL